MTRHASITPRILQILGVGCSLAVATVSPGCGAGLPSDSSEGQLTETALGATQPHPAPAYMPRSTRFSVRIKDSSGTWKALDVLGDINGYDYAHFSVGPGG